MKNEEIAGKAKIMIEICGYGSFIGKQIREKIFEIFEEWDYNRLTVVLAANESLTIKQAPRPLLHVFCDCQDRQEIQEIVDRLKEIRCMIIVSPAQFWYPSG